MCLCVCVCYVYAVHRGQGGADPLELKSQAAVSCPMWVLDLNSSPLEEQQVLLTSEHISPDPTF